MTPNELARRFPTLWHVAHPGAWPSIQQRGLISTEQLVDLFEVADPDRNRILTERRRRPVILEHPEHGTAVIRDQKPLIPGNLAKVLTDMTPQQWCGTLNNRVFFWPDPKRRDSMMAAYSREDLLVLTVNTASLLDAHLDRVELSHINSGTVRFANSPRGSGTFRPIPDYDQRSLAELCVVGGVPDVLDHVEAVDLHHAHDGSIEPLLNG